MPDIGPVSVTLLGTGTSTGVPVIGCTCRVCTSDDPRDARTRTACWIRVNGISIIIDTGPDFRQQALRGSEIDNTYIKPAVRRALEDAWKRSDTADIDVTEEADA